MWEVPSSRNTVVRQTVSDQLNLKKVLWKTPKEILGDKQWSSVRFSMDVLDEGVLEKGLRPLGVQARDWFLQNLTRIPKQFHGRNLFFMGDIFKDHPSPHEMVSYYWMCCGYRHFPVIAWENGQAKGEGRWFSADLGANDIVACTK